MSYIQNQDFTAENLDTAEMFMSDISEDICDFLVHLEMPADGFIAHRSDFLS